MIGGGLELISNSNDHADDRISYIDRDTYIPLAGQSVTTGGNSPAILPVGGYAKRFVDIVLVILAFLPLGLLIILTALLIKLFDRKGPLIFGHRRVGFNGREFTCWKFRTMRADGDAVLAAHLRDNPHLISTWENSRKLAKDPRVTPIGAVLRSLSLDELPQLFNILAGDMSIVGPRPVVQDELKLYGDKAAYYLSARPGLTGLWQVSGRSNTSYAARVRMDQNYVLKWNMWSDVKIILLTVRVVLTSRGAC